MLHSNHCIGCTKTGGFTGEDKQGIIIGGHDSTMKANCKQLPTFSHLTPGNLKIVTNFIVI